MHGDDFVLVGMRSHLDVISKRMKSKFQVKIAGGGPEDAVPHRELN